MTTDEALDLALEALEESHPEAYRHVITAIKQARALDKKAENARELGLDYEPAPKQRWAVFCRFCKKEWSVSYKHPGKSVCVDCDNALPAQPAPVQEPLTDEHIERIYHRYGGNMINCARAIERAVFAAQRQWVGLTPEEIDTVYRNLPLPVQHWQLARAIEAKLKEKNT